MTDMERAERFARQAPPLNQAEKDAINALFPAYIFRRSRTSEIWTTCCHRHMVVRNEDMMMTTQERDFQAVMWTLHQREPKNRWTDPPQPGVKCPFCGEMAIVKELGRTGNRDNLSRYRRAVVLRWYRGALWARAYDCGKHYSKDEGYSLTGEPNCKLVGVYRFKPGLAECSTRYYCCGNYPFSSVERQTGPLTEGRWHIHSPFNANAEYGIGYNVIGLDEIQKSPFRYCMVEQAERKTDKLLQFLVACCFYPRQIEMLMKADMSDVVMDLTERGVKHAAVLNWEEPDPAKAFAIGRQELKIFLGTSRDIRVLELYKRLKGRIPMAECAKWLSEDLNIRKTFSAAKRWSLPPEKLMRYLDSNVGCAQYGGVQSMDSALRFWEDYLTAAEAMGYQLHRENVLLPRNLGTAHNEATGQHRARLEQERRTEQERREAQRLIDQRERDLLMAETYAKRKVKLEALSQANAQEMAALTAEAKELGAITKFTAQEAGDAMGYMAMAGWGATDMLQGMDGVLQLAAASGEDLAMVSDIVTDSLSAFGLTAKDTAHFSDVLAAAATNSNTNVAIMGETFKMSASVAGALGYSIEDVAVAMGLMANSGVKGSIAGTALRNTFNGLLEGVTLTGAAFGEYEYSAIKADGTMKSFGSTIDELRGYFERMTEAERVANAQAIAGQRGYNGLLAILNATDADYASLTESINNCTGAAQRMAAVKLDNLNGQLTLMDSAWDALKTTLGEEFTPELRGLAELATELLGDANEFVKEHPALVKGLLASGAAVGAGAAALTGVAAVTKVLIPLMAALTKVLIPLMAALTAATPGVNIIMGVTAAVAGVAGVVTALATAANEGIPSVKELSEAARDMRKAMDEAGETYEETARQTMATAEVADLYISKLEEIEAATDGNVEGNREYQNILGLLLRTVPELSDCISETTDQYGRSTYTLETTTEALRRNTEAWKKNAEAQAYQEYINSLYDQYGEVLAEAAENEIKLTQAQVKLEAVEQKRNAAMERLNELTEQAGDAAGTNDLRTRAEPAISAMLSGGGDDGFPPVQIVFQISGNATPETVQALRDYGDEFADRVREVLEDMSADAKRRAY